MNNRDHKHMKGRCLLCGCDYCKRNRLRERLHARGSGISKRTRDVINCIKYADAFVFPEQLARKLKSSLRYARKVQQHAREVYVRYPVYGRKLMDEGMVELYVSQGRVYDDQARNVFHSLTARRDGLKQGANAREWQATVRDGMQHAQQRLSSTWTLKEMASEQNMRPINTDDL